MPIPSTPWPADDGCIAGMPNMSAAARPANHCVPGASNAFGANHIVAAGACGATKCESAGTNESSLDAGGKLATVAADDVAAMAGPTGAGTVTSAADDVAATAGPRCAGTPASAADD